MDRLTDPTADTYRRRTTPLRQGATMRNLAIRLLALLGLVVAMTMSPVGVATAAHHAPPASPDDPLLHRQARTDEELKRQIELQLKLAPGGKQTAVNEVSYADGKFVVTFALPSSSGSFTTAAAADCPVGWFCFYDGANFGYPRGKLSDCGWQDLANWGWQDRTSSVHNNRGPRVDYINFFDVFLFANTNGQAIASLGSNNNKADHVRLYC
jgi:hypothetical protein